MSRAKKDAKLKRIRDLHVTCTCKHEKEMHIQTCGEPISLGVLGSCLVVGCYCKKFKAARNTKSKLSNLVEHPVNSLTRDINEALARQKTSGEHLRQIDALCSAYEKLEAELHPEVVIHALTTRCVSLYRQLTVSADNNYCLILLSSLANSLELCVRMYHNVELYGNIIGDTDK